jgi:hypothetical protein
MFVPAPHPADLPVTEAGAERHHGPQRRNLVSSCMYFCGHHMTHFVGLPQSSPRPSDLSRKTVMECEIGGSDRRVATCFPRDKSAYAVAHAQNTFPANTARLKTGFRPGHSGACEAACINSPALRTVHAGESPVKQARRVTYTRRSSTRGNGIPIWTFSVWNWWP